MFSATQQLSSPWWAYSNCLSGSWQWPDINDLPGLLILIPFTFLYSRKSRLITVHVWQSQVTHVAASVVRTTHWSGAHHYVAHTDIHNRCLSCHSEQHNGVLRLMSVHSSFSLLLLPSHSFLLLQREFSMGYNPSGKVCSAVGLPYTAVSIHSAIFLLLLHPWRSPLFLICFSPSFSLWAFIALAIKYSIFHTIWCGIFLWSIHFESTLLAMLLPGLLCQPTSLGGG